MNKLREKRLLLLATIPNAGHKRFYSQYCHLINKELVWWGIGTAYLTPDGEKRLKELIDEN
jgi:hypothetical protein